MKNNRDMRDEMECFFHNLIKVLGIAFGLLGAISVFVPFSDMVQGLFTQCMILLGILVIVIVASLIMTTIDIHRKSNLLYSSNKAKISFEYGDFKKIMQQVDLKEEECCLVVPVNTSLEYLFDRKHASKNTIHREALEYIYAKLGKDLDANIFASLKVKKGNFDSAKGEVGDWFLISPDDLAIDSKLSFLFLELFNKIERNGKLVNEELSKKEYLLGMQALIEAIPNVLDQQELVYLPLIGAGAGNVGRPKDIMVFMKELLRFNKSNLCQDIRVVVNEKRKNDVPIYELKKF